VLEKLLGRGALEGILAAALLEKVARSLGFIGEK
jgi:hypothetical protein